MLAKDRRGWNYGRIEKNEKLFDDRELENLSDEKIHLTDRINEDLKKELDDYFKKNKIKYDYSV